jgi:hypothetical protein
MSWLKWTLIAACVLTACSSGSSSGKAASTTTTTSKAGTVAANAWKDVAQGTFAKQKWTVASAHSSAGWRCFDVQGVTPANATTTTVGGAPTRDGRAVHCLAPTSTSQSAPFVAFVNGTEAKDWVLVGAAADGVKKVSLVYANGTSSPLNIDPRTRLVIWKGPASVKPEQVRTDKTTCTIASAAATASKPLCEGVSSGA